METPLGEWFGHPRVGGRVKDALGFGSAQVSDEQMAMLVSMTMEQFINISGLDISRNSIDELIAASHPV